MLFCHLGCSKWNIVRFRMIVNTLKYVQKFSNYRNKEAIQQARAYVHLIFLVSNLARVSSLFEPSNIEKAEGAMDLSDVNKDKYQDFSKFEIGRLEFISLASSFSIRHFVQRC
jgi:hypothetical protein